MMRQNRHGDAIMYLKKTGSIVKGIFQMTTMTQIQRSNFHIHCIGVPWKTRQLYTED